MLDMLIRSSRSFYAGISVQGGKRRFQTFQNLFFRKEFTEMELWMFIGIAIVSVVILLIDYIAGGLLDVFDITEGVTWYGIRIMLIFAACFGIGGALASASGWPLWESIGCGMIAAVLFSFLCAYFIRIMKRTEYSSIYILSELKDMEGMSAEMITPENAGNVCLTVRGMTQYVRALSTEGDIPKDTKVVVKDASQTPIRVERMLQ